MIHASADGVIVTVRVIPRAGRSAVAGTRGGKLLVRLAAAPVDGAANEELVSMLARVFDRPKREVTIVSGAHGRRKRVAVTGIDSDAAAAKLAPLLS